MTQRRARTERKSSPTPVESPRAELAIEARAARPSLTEGERKVLDEALARGAAVHKTVDEAVLSFGVWLFQNVFGADTRAAIDHRGDSVLWTAFFDAADSAKLRLSEQLVEDAVLCAAYDKRLNSDAWRSLDFARKSRLLRLGDDKLMRKGAAHVLASNLTATKTELYVREVLAEARDEEIQRRVDPGRVRSQFDKLAERLEDKTFLRQLESNTKKLDPSRRETIAESVARLRTALDEIERRLAKGG